MHKYFFLGLPFAFLYGSISWIIRKLYEIGIFKQYQFKTPTICVGNLSVGGTGKTPHVEYLIAQLCHSYKIAVLSRGYGRKTKGFIKVETNHCAEEVGDEPLQYATKFNTENVSVFVDENRVEAIQNIEKNYPVDLIILDDAFQHFKLKCTYKILLTDYSHLFYKDYPLPAGRLREFRHTADKADYILVTKCPAITLKKQTEIIEQIRHYTKIPVDFSHIQYQPLNSVKTSNLKLTDSFTTQRPLILFSGIANTQPLINYLSQNYNITDTILYKDHYQFKISDLNHILKIAHQTPHSAIVSTEKDAMRLINQNFLSVFKSIDYFYLPIKISLDSNHLIKDILTKINI